MKPEAHVSDKRPPMNAQNGLDSRARFGLTVSEGGADDGALGIERVEVTRSERPPEPGAREALEQLLARWMVRAYLRQATEDAAAKESATAGIEEVA